MRLKDKGAIVTGAGVGIGVEYSKRLAAEDAKVVCTDTQGGHADRGLGKGRFSNGASLPRMHAAPLFF